jgi:DNA end-binding protein Ku
MGGVRVNERELAVASTLVDALAEQFDPEKYRDHYREALLELIKSKTEGREVVVPEGAPPAAKATDLMSALRASIEAAKQRKGGSHEPVKAAARDEHPKKERAARKPAAKKPAAKKSKSRAA